MTKALLVALALFGCLAAPVRAQQADPPLKVTAKLVKIPGAFPPDELYDYAYVMQYQVVGGKLDKQVLLVAHYKPRRARDKIGDKMSKLVKGTLKRFREGDIHELLLSPDLKKMKKQWGGAVQDEFFATDRKSVRYFCLRADPSKAK
jgi:hypothetical protein